MPWWDNSLSKGVNVRFWGREKYTKYNKIKTIQKTLGNKIAARGALLLLAPFSCGPDPSMFSWESL